MCAGCARNSKKCCPHSFAGGFLSFFAKKIAFFSCICVRFFLDKKEKMYYNITVYKCAPQGVHLQTMRAGLAKPRFRRNF